MWQEAQLAWKILTPSGSFSARAGLISVNLNMAIANTMINKSVLKRLSSQQALSNWKPSVVTILLRDLVVSTVANHYVYSTPSSVSVEYEGD